VTLGLASAPAGAGLAGGTSAVAVAGVASFSGLVLTTAGAYSLSASTAGLTVTGGSFSIGAGPAKTLGLISGGGQSAPGGTALSVPIVMKVGDAYGNAVSGVTITFAPVSGSVSATTVTSPGTGLVQTTWTLGTTAGPQTLNVSGPGLLPNPFAVTATATTGGVAGPATQLTFTTQPTTRTAGLAITPAIVVTAKDAAGNVATSFTGNIVLGIQTNLGGSSLSGTLTVAAVAGVATFSNVSLNKVGTGYALQASSAGLTPATSSAFNITAGTAAAIVADSGNLQIGTASTALAAPFVVRATDANGNGVSGVTVTWAVASGGGSLSATSTTTDANGRARTTLTMGASAGTNTVTATSTGLTGSPLTFTANTGVQGATQLVFTSGPATVVAGVPQAAIVVTAKDALGNTATGFTGVVNLNLSANAFGATIWNGTTGINAVNGVATFASPNIQIRKAATGLTLTASSTSLPTVTSATFDVTTGPAYRTVIDSGDAQTGITGATLAKGLFATVWDSVGNPVAGVTGLSWGTPTGGGSLSGTTTTTSVKGQVTATWTLGATPGSQSVTLYCPTCAGEAASSTSPATFTATATAAGFTKQWVGSSGSWSSSGNWLPSGVPTTSDVVYIPAGLANDPALSANITVAGLTLAAGAQLNTNGFTVDITGNLDAGTTIIGGGTVNLTGTGTMKGVVVGNVNVTGTYTVTAADSVNGNLTVGTGGALTIGGAGLVGVSGNFSTTGTGTLAMSSGTSQLLVWGSASFGGGSETGLITDGLIQLAGNLSGTSGGRYQATAGGNANVRFVGAAAKSVSGAQFTFRHIDLTGAGTVTFAASATNSTVAGNIAFQAGAGNVAGHVQVVYAGTIISDLVGGRWQVDSTSIGGCGCAIALPSVLHGLLRGGGNALLGSSFTVDSMEVYSGTITWNNQAVTSLGVFRTKGNGSIAMASGALTVMGDADFSGGQSDLSGGGTDFRGNFQQTAANNGRAFRAQSGHTTTFAGSGAQSISFASPDSAPKTTCGNSCFGNLTIGKPSGTLTFSSVSAVQGNLVVGSGVTAVTAVATAPGAGNGRLAIVKGTVTTAAGTGVHFSNLTARGALALDTASVVDSITYAGNGSQTMLNRAFARITIRGAPLVSTALTASKTIVVDSGSFDPNGHAVTIDTLRTQGTGVFAGTNAADSVTVNVLLGLGGGSSAPTAGRLYLANGNVALADGAAAFGAGHVTWVMKDSATVTQTITAPASPVTPPTLGAVHFANSSPKSVTGTMNFAGDVTVEGTSPAVTGATASIGIGGHFKDHTNTVSLMASRAGAPRPQANAVLRSVAAGFSPAALYDPNGGWQVLATKMTGASKTIDAEVMATTLSITGTISLARDLTLNGNVTVSGTGATLDLTDAVPVGHALAVLGSFATASGGVLKMTDPDDYLYVSQNAAFGGGSTAGKLTHGLIEVIGNFTQNGSASAFAADSTLETDIGYYPAVLADARPAASRRGTRAGAGPAGTRRIQPPAAAARLVDTRAARMRQRRDSITAAIVARHPAAPRGMSRADVAARVRDMRSSLSRRGAAFAQVGVATFSELPPASVITFANPGFANSHFGYLYISGENVVLASDVYAEGQFGTGISMWHYVSSTTTAPADQRTITSRGADVRDLSFDNVRWVLLDGNGLYSFDYVEFYDMDPAVDQFTINRNGTLPGMLCDCVGPELYSWYFDVTPTTGHFVNVIDSDGPTTNGLQRIKMIAPSPATHGGHVAASDDVNTQIVNWVASFTWVGAYMSGSWTYSSNWSTGFAPSSGDDVTIPSGTPFAPQIPYNAGSFYDVHDLTIAAGATIGFSCGSGLNVYGNLVASTTSNATSTCEGEGIHLVGDGSGYKSVVGRFDLLEVEGPYRINGTGAQLVVMDNLKVKDGGELVVNGNRLDVGGPGGVGGWGEFMTVGTGTLTMSNTADIMYVGDGGAHFTGAPSNLTAGTLTMVGSGCLSTGGSHANAFAPSGTHKVVFAGTGNCVSFADPVQSFFQDVAINGGTQLNVQTSNPSYPGFGFNVNGTLSKGTGAGTMTIAGYGGSYRSINVSGLNISGSATLTDIGVRILAGPAVTFDNVTWTSTAAVTTSLLVTTRGSANFTFTGHNFSGVTLGTGGLFVENTQASATVHMVSSLPSAGLVAASPKYAGYNVVWDP
jgi:hypothetical protein